MPMGASIERIILRKKMGRSAGTTRLSSAAASAVAPRPEAAAKPKASETSAPRPSARPLPATARPGVAALARMFAPAAPAPEKRKDETADVAPAPTFNLTKLQTAFRHNVSGTGVFESSQHPIIVGQAAYNPTYGSNFAAGGDCSTNLTANRCDGFARIGDTAQFTFNTLRQQSSRQTMPVQAKAIHDEMNAVNFDEFGRMSANLGITVTGADLLPATGSDSGGQMWLALGCVFAGAVLLLTSRRSGHRA